MKTVDQILEDAITDGKKRRDDARATTLRLAELNALTIYQQASERPQRIKKAVDAMVEKIASKISE
jgi:F0F1-type ATP synthase membrane subunit b/b'